MAVYIVVGIFILFDIGTGIIKAVYHGDINSTALRQGLFHKLSEIVAIAGSGLLEYGMEYVNLGVKLPLVGVVATYLCVTELISILENLSDVNPVLAKFFKPYLEKLRDKEEETTKENEKETEQESKVEDEANKR